MKMKKSILIIVAVALVLVMSLSVLAFNYSGKDTDKQDAKYKVGINGTISVSLSENPSTGYSWHYTVNKKDILEFVSDEFKSDDTQGLVGSAGTHEFKFKAIMEGVVKLTFQYYRTWEGINKDTETREYVIKIKKGEQNLLELN